MIRITKDVNKLVEDNIKLAYSVAWKYYPMVSTHIEFDDVLSICYEGLINAAKLYDSDMGYAFSTYAYISIRNTLLCRFRHYQIKYCSNSISLNSTTDEGVLIADTISSDFDLEETVSNKLIIDNLYKYIDELPKDLQLVIRLKLEGATQIQIAKKLNITQPGVSRKYIKALNMLRSKFEKEGMM